MGVATTLTTQAIPEDLIVGGATLTITGYVHLDEPPEKVVVAIYKIRVFDDATNTLLFDNYPPAGAPLLTSMYCENKPFTFDLTIPATLEGKRTLRIEAYHPARLPQVDATAYLPPRPEPPPEEKPLNLGVLLLLGFILLAAGGKRK